MRALEGRRTLQTSEEETGKKKHCKSSHEFDVPAFYFIADLNLMQQSSTFREN